mmetsp:Transcript_468/g.605  ORF Transcript_468/g.605 Transcript_468/m.605 type:complete len:88 (-) Transcript_468:1714-1977(-)
MDRCNGNDPPHAYLEEAERLTRDQIRTNCHFIDAYVRNAELLCEILRSQSKFAEAKRILSPFLKEAQQVRGPSHHLRKKITLAFYTR